MPYLFAVVAELCLAAFPLTGQLWAAGTAIGNNSITAVRGRAPAAVRVRGQVAAQHELLVLVHERGVGEQQADVVRVESLAALGAADGHPALADLQAQVVAEAVPARAVRATEEARGPLGRQPHQAERALHLLRARAAALRRLLIVEPRPGRPAAWPGRGTWGRARPRVEM